MARSKKEEAAFAIASHKLFTDELAEMIMRRGGADCALMALEREFFQTITVPNLHQTDFLDLVKTRCDLTYLYPGYRDEYMFSEWTGRGRTFRFLIWTPGRTVASREVREYFKAKGFYGHASAFMAWIADKKPVGLYATIPDDKDCFLMNSRRGTIYVPLFQSTNGQRKLDWNDYYTDWGGDQSFVGFRELGG